MHTNHARDFDRPAPMSSPPPMEAHLPEDTVMWEGMHDDNQSSAETGGSSLFASVPPTAASGSEYASGTIHGPAILGDSADQIYNDWAGELSYLDELDGVELVDEEPTTGGDEALPWEVDGDQSDEDVEDKLDAGGQVTGLEDELDDELLLGQESVTAEERGKSWFRMISQWY